MFRLSKLQMRCLETNRKAWLIHDLLDNPLTQKDILNLWRNKGKIRYEELKKYVEKGKTETTMDDLKMWKPKKFKDGVGISKSSLSKIINGYKSNNNYKTGLIDKKILEKTFVNGKPGYCLVETHEALYKILTEFNNPILREDFSTGLKKDLMNSEYAKRVINLDLVKKMGYIKDEDDQNNVLTILKISPSALLKFLKEVRDREVFIKNSKDTERGMYFDEVLFKGNIYPRIFMDLESATESLLKDLQIQVYNDISCPFNLLDDDVTFKSQYPVEIEYEIKMSLRTEKNIYKNVVKLKKSSFRVLSEEIEGKQDVLNDFGYMCSPLDYERAHSPLI